MPVEGRGLGSVSTQEVARDGRLGNLSTPLSVQKLQAALHAKAKSSDCYRFYALYDKIHRQDILAHMPGPSAAPTGGHRAWTVRTLPTTGAVAQEGDVSTGSDSPGVHSQAQWQVKAIGHLDRAGSGLHDSSDAGAGTDLRGRSATGAVCVPAGPNAQQAAIEAAVIGEGARRPRPCLSPAVDRRA
jgi:hypothetical protein